MGQLDNIKVGMFRLVILCCFVVICAGQRARGKNKVCDDGTTPKCNDGTAKPPCADGNRPVCEDGTVLGGNAGGRKGCEDGTAEPPCADGKKPRCAKGSTAVCGSDEGDTP